jgi:hypothetical protein
MLEFLQGCDHFYKVVLFSIRSGLLITVSCSLKRQYTQKCIASGNATIGEKWYVNEIENHGA